MPGWMTQILEVNMPKLETRLWFAPFGAFLFLKRSLLLFTMTGQDDKLKMSCDPLGLKTKFQTIMIWWCQSWGQYFWNLHARAGLPDSGGTFRCIPLFQKVLFKFPPKITGPPPKTRIIWAGFQQRLQASTGWAKQGLRHQKHNQI